MMIGRRFSFKTFDMHKMAIIIIAEIALTAHAAGAMLVQLIKIFVNDFSCRLLPALHDRERHDIP